MMLSATSDVDYYGGDREPLPTCEIPRDEQEPCAGFVECPRCQTCQEHCECRDLAAEALLNASVHLKGEDEATKTARAMIATRYFAVLGLWK